MISPTSKKSMDKISKVLSNKKQKTKPRKNHHQPRILYPVKLLFKYEKEIKTFLDKHK